ncbi:MAG: glycosyltransferase, partial [Clostridia bacterium]
GKYTTGGIKSVIMNYYNKIDRNLIQFDLLVDSDSPLKDYSDIENLGGKVYEVTPVTNPIKNILECVKIFKENDYYCIHGYINTLNVFPMLAGKIAGVPVRISENLSTSHSGEKKTFLKNILKPLSHLFPTHIAANSKYAANWIYGEKNLNKCKIIRNALDLEKYKYDEELRSSKRSELGVSDNFVIGHIGRYEYQKNHEFLIDIFYEAYKKDSSCRLLLVGYGELKDEIFSKIKSLELNDVVIDAGATENILSLYNAMDCFALPSFYEGLPVVGIEAQATGLPCVISTEVTTETDITGLVKFVDLKKTSECWASEILKYKNEKRENTYEKVTENGYNIKNEVVELQNYYLDICKCNTKKMRKK